MTNNDNAIEIAEIKGLLKGINDDIQEIKRDIIYIKKNDKEKLQRITSLEKEQELLTKWREGHINANKKTNIRIDNLSNKIDETNDRIDKDKHDANQWRIGQFAVILILLIGIIVDLIFKYI